MRRLFILRHLKTGWALPGQRDIDRTLTDRGLEDGQIVADWISERKLTPDVVFCSPAQRTRQTLAAIQSSFRDPMEIRFHDPLYMGNIREYLDALASEANAESAMIIGHNPTCSSLANFLIDPSRHTGNDAAADSITYKYPTGALAIFKLDIKEWTDISQGCGILEEFLMPKAFRGN